MVRRGLKQPAGAWLPPQHAPIRRPQLIDPYAVIDLVHGDVEDLVTARILLIHGANYNDPPHYRMRSLHAFQRM